MKLFFLSFFLLVSCAGVKPVKDYALASMALKSAREYQAHIHAKGLWHRAQVFFQKGEIYTKDKDFGTARSYFIKSREYSEKAELLSRLKKRQKLGLTDLDWN